MPLGSIPSTTKNGGLGTHLTANRESKTLLASVPILDMLTEVAHFILFFFLCWHWGLNPGVFYLRATPPALSLFFILKQGLSFRASH